MAVTGSKVAEELKNEPCPPGARLVLLFCLREQSRGYDFLIYGIAMACKIDEARIESVALENKCIRSWTAVAG